MKHFIFLVTLVVLSNSATADCEFNSQLLGAKYKITSTSSAKHNSHVQNMTLWRNNKQVAHQYTDNHITELWEQTKNGLLRLERHFDNHQRAIEYEPIDINHGKGEKDWSIKFQLVSNKLKNNMRLVNTTGKGCDKVETYTLTNSHEQLTLKWLPAQQLVKSFIVKQHKMNIEWRLENTIRDQNKIKKLFTNLIANDTTDYADIGDNESDPFLLKMMNLGFIEHSHSGFYNSDGHSIK